MTDSEVRCVCAHMYFWGEGLAKALQDCGICSSLSEAVESLMVRKWFYDEETDSIHWTGLDPVPIKATPIQ